MAGSTATFAARTENAYRTDMDLYGEQGDDEIWLGSSLTGEGIAFGGSGDDKVYNGDANFYGTYLYGGSGKDLLRNDWF